MTDLLVRSADQVGSDVEVREPPKRSRRIVVAVDGSEASIEALRWTKAELLQRGDTLCAITAFAPPLATPEAPVCVDMIHQSAECARTAAELAIQDVFGSGDQGVVVDHVLAAGNIESLAVRESADAAMIVLGEQQARGWFARRRPSATKRVMRYAACPVLSVPITAKLEASETD